MRKLILLLSLAVVSCHPTYAQENRPTGKSVLTTIPCDTFDKIFPILETAGERLMFTMEGGVGEATTGKYYGGAVGLWANLEKNTASVTIMFGDGNICLMTPGKNFTPWTGPQPWDDKK